MSTIFQRQHRTHAFSLFIFQGQARVIRWDRAGAVVSTIIDFEQQPSLLKEIIWQYAHMSQAHRGFDCTAMLATKEEIEAMRTCPASDEWISQRRNNALDQRGWPAYKIKMRLEDIIDQHPLKPIACDVRQDDPDPGLRPDTTNAVSLVVGKAYFATDTLDGRGTKCYIAYDLGRDRLVFLKNFWRPSVDSLMLEGEVLRELRTFGVENVPTPLAAGDVLVNEDPQETRKQDHSYDNGRITRRSASLVHHRLVLLEICRPLEAHEDALVLVRALTDAFEGMPL